MSYKVAHFDIVIDFYFMLYTYLRIYVSTSYQS